MRTILDILTTMFIIYWVVEHPQHVAYMTGKVASLVGDILSVAPEVNQ